MTDSQSPYQAKPSDVLRQYADGSLTTRELAGWLSEAEYDDAISAEVRDLLASVRLVIMDAAENLAPEKDEVLKAVAAALAELEPDVPVVLQRASSDTTWAEPPVTGEEPHVVRGRISAGTAA